MTSPKKTAVKKTLDKKKPASKKATASKKVPASPASPIVVEAASTAPIIKKLNVPATMASAITLHQKGQRREAYLTCELILRADPRQAGAFHLMGIIAIENQDFSLAMRLINESLAIDHNNFVAHNNLGVVLRVLKDSLAAASHFEKAVSLKPDYAEAFNNLGVVLRDLNRPEEALEQFRKALKIKPDYKDAKLNEDLILKTMEANTGEVK